MRPALNAVFKEMADKIEELSAVAGGDGMLEAHKAGLLDIEIYKLSDLDGMVRDFLDSVGSAVLSGSTFPLFDDSTGDLVRAAIDAGVLPNDSIGTTQGRIAGLAADLLGRLPMFDSVGLTEVLAIRKELDGPLVRFRSAIIGYSRTIVSAQWDANFKAEVNLTFQEHIAPAIQEIEDAVKSNSLVRGILGKVGTPLVVPAATSTLGLVVSNVASFSPIAGAFLGVGLGGASVAASVVRDWQERNKDIERNQMYFYYRVGHQLVRHAR